MDVVHSVGRGYSSDIVFLVSLVLERRDHSHVWNSQMIIRRDDYVGLGLSVMCSSLRLCHYIRRVT